MDPCAAAAAILVLVVAWCEPRQPADAMTAGELAADARTTPQPLALTAASRAASERAALAAPASRAESRRYTFEAECVDVRGLPIRGMTLALAQQRFPAVEMIVSAAQLQAISAAKLQAGVRTGTSDAQGMVRVDDLEEGEHEIAALHPDLTWIDGDEHGNARFMGKVRIPCARERLVFGERHALVLEVVGDRMLDATYGMRPEEKRDTQGKLKMNADPGQWAKARLLRDQHPRAVVSVANPTSAQRLAGRGPTIVRLQLLCEKKGWVVIDRDLLPLSSMPCPELFAVSSLPDRPILGKLRIEITDAAGRALPIRGIDIRPSTGHWNHDYLREANAGEDHVCPAGEYELRLQEESSLASEFEMRTAKVEIGITTVLPIRLAHSYVPVQIVWKGDIPEAVIGFQDALGNWTLQGSAAHATRLGVCLPPGKTRVVVGPRDARLLDLVFDAVPQHGDVPQRVVLEPKTGQR